MPTSLSEKKSLNRKMVISTFCINLRGVDLTSITNVRTFAFGVGGMGK